MDKYGIQLRKNVNVRETTFGMVISVRNLKSAQVIEYTIKLLISASAKMDSSGMDSLV